MLQATVYIYSSHSKPPRKEDGVVSVNNVPIPKVTSTKFLGVYVDQSLKWNDHVEKIN